jgi:hypothetical protein
MCVLIVTVVSPQTSTALAVCLTVLKHFVASLSTLPDHFQLDHGAEPPLRSRDSRSSQHFMEIEGSLPCSQQPSTAPKPFVTFRNKLIFYGEEFLGTCLSPLAGGPPITGCQRLFIQYIRSYSPYLEVVSSIRNLRTRHAVVTRDSPNMGYII